MSSCVVAGGAPETRHCSHLGCSESNERSGDQRAAAFGMSLLFLPSASFAGSFLSLSLSPTLDRSSRSSSGETTISPLPLFLSLVTQLLRHHGTNIPQSLSRLSRSVHVDTAREAAVAAAGGNPAEHTCNAPQHRCCADVAVIVITRAP